MKQPCNLLCTQIILAYRLRLMHPVPFRRHSGMLSTHVCDMICAFPDCLFKAPCERGEKTVFYQRGRTQLHNCVICTLEAPTTITLPQSHIHSILIV